MAFKYTFILAIFVFTFYIISEAALVRREAPTTEKSVSQTLQEAMDSIKASLGDLTKNMENNDVIKNITESLNKFGDTIKQKSADLVKKIEAGVKTD